MRKRQNFGLKSFTAPSTFTFRFLSSALLLLNFSHFFLLLGIHWLHFRRKRFWERPEDREIILKEVPVGSGTTENFSEIFWWKLHGSYMFLSGLFHWMGLIWVRFERSRPPTQVDCQSCLEPLKWWRHKWHKGLGSHERVCAYSGVNGLMNPWWHFSAWSRCKGEVNVLSNATIWPTTFTNLNKTFKFDLLC